MYKVVLIDDEQLIIEGLTKAFPWEEYNCEIVGTGNNGFKGLEIIKLTSPDILITDISMAQMTGLEMIEKLINEFPNMQIIVLTAFRDFSYAKEAIKLGVLRYLLKPSKMNELTEAILAATEKLKLENSDKIEVIHKDIEGENPLVDNVILYIEKNYDKKLSLKQISKEFFVSEWHLSKLMKKHTNESFSTIVNNIRIEKAKELLKNPYLKSVEIAEMTGFTDLSAFSKVFKKHTGITPNEYRKNK